jgi:outer membrane biosynthesis protein TonB
LPFPPNTAPLSSRIACKILRLTQESKILKYIEPEYPDNTRTSRGDISVCLKAKADHDGKVTDVHFFWSDPSSGQAAAAAVKQWVFEPILIDGVPIDSIRAIEIVFHGESKKAAARAWLYPVEFDVHEFLLPGSTTAQSPKVVRKVGPTYPESARSQHMEGAIAMEALFSEAGRIEAILIWRSIPSLEEAAIEAFSQWIFEPFTFNNAPSKFVIKFFSRFQLGR